MTGCPHVPLAHAQRWAPVECPICGGWVDEQLNVLSPEVALARYPAQAALIARTIPVRPTVTQRVERGSWSVFKFAGNLAIILIGIPIVAVLLLITVEIAKHA